MGKDAIPGADRDKYTYGHDRNSNRLYRENTVTSAKDEHYTVDRLTSSGESIIDLIISQMPQPEAEVCKTEYAAIQR